MRYSTFNLLCSLLICQKKTAVRNHFLWLVYGRASVTPILLVVTVTCKDRALKGQGLNRQFLCLGGGFQLKNVFIFTPKIGGDYIPF